MDRKEELQLKGLHPVIVDIDEVSKKLGQRARRIREKRRMTQNDVALVSNLHINTIKNFESGKPATFGTVLAVSESLEVSLYYITKGIV